MQHLNSKNLTKNAKKIRPHKASEIFLICQLLNSRLIDFKEFLKYNKLSI